ncbi:MAG: hypothetical protein J3R72DRAFT_125736 [Linnemannia gamsii]|nr:MAG: hypothetical protein J3R72DRAFT_125736 [Linnemannia gamsii]
MRILKVDNLVGEYRRLLLINNGEMAEQVVALLQRSKVRRMRLYCQRPSKGMTNQRNLQVHRATALFKDERIANNPQYNLTIFNIDTTFRLDHFATLGQAVIWNVDDTDMVQKFQEFRADNQGPFSLARDGIADLTQDSLFCQTLEPNVLSIVRRAEPAPNIHERWPTLGPICDRVFMSNNYDDVANAVRSESMQDPIAAYLFVVIMAYWQYFQFYDDIPENINEREGFTGLTWSFLQTPLTLYGLQSRYLEVLITAVEGRKNQDKDHLQDVKEIGQYADAVALHNNQQLLLAEAALIHNPKLEKRRQDEYKLVRAMRA